MPDEYLIVSKKILPEYYDLVIKTREELQEKKYDSVLEACKANGISRSTFYKYKDYLYRISEREEGKKCVLSLTVRDEKGVLSDICNRLSQLEVSILTISQALPIDKRAILMISLDITHLSFGISVLIQKLKEIQTVLQVELLSIS